MNSVYPAFSVVMPTCDRPIFLREAFASVLEQSRPAHEIIIVDNGSVPVSALEWPPGQSIRLIRALPRFGVAQARNLGAILASGDYIAFLDDDDTWDASYLQSARETINATDADIVVGRLRHMADGHPVVGKQAVVADRDHLVRQLLKRNPGIVGSNTIIRKRAFDQHPGYDPWLPPHEDKALVLDLLLNRCRIASADAAWVNWRHDHDSPRLTDLKNRIKGKYRFLRKYWHIMPTDVRLYNLAQIFRLRVLILLGNKR